MLSNFYFKVFQTISTKLLSFAVVLLMLFITFLPKSHAQFETNCENSNFSSGDFTNWEGCYGYFTREWTPEGWRYIMEPCDEAGFNIPERHEIIAAPGSPITKKPLAKLSILKYGTILIGSIYRHGAWRIAVGNTHIQANERAIVICISKHLKDVRKLFQI